ncbi:MAG: four helix bundle protein [Chitinophagales bacterium]|nr:four helix bundle protein [Chitinophagales bacterium]
MFLRLSHTQKPVYKDSSELVSECYRITAMFPKDEKFAMISQIRRAALSVHLNIAEGCSRRSETERIRYFEIARGSVIEVDAAIGIAIKLDFCKMESFCKMETLILSCFKQLSALIGK